MAVLGEGGHSDGSRGGGVTVMAVGGGGGGS